jgi:hypothetical protein
MRWCISVSLNLLIVAWGQACFLGGGGGGHEPCYATENLLELSREWRIGVKCWVGPSQSTELACLI